MPKPTLLLVAVVALDISVLLWLSGLDVLDSDAVFLGPDQQLATDVFRAVVDPYGAGFSTYWTNATWHGALLRPKSNALLVWRL